MEILRGVSVVITGASSGIGRATARAFAEHGAHLARAGGALLLAGAGLAYARSAR